MCGILMEPQPDAVKGRKLTLEQALSHIGGAENLISEHGRHMIRTNAEDYIWKYPDGAAWCTACGAELRGLKYRQNEVLRCPACGKSVTFKHERKGHKTIFDQFVMYEWRRSAVDPQAITLTAVHAWRDSTGERPENEPLNAAPCALYVFRPGKAVTVFKASPWRRNAPADGHNWHRVNSVGPEHTKFGGSVDIVIDDLQFREALRGTRIGKTFEALCGFSNRRDDLELTAVASCARRPWLEYLAKSGQGKLAARLMRMGRIPKDLVPNQRARTPRALLGLTEGQWFEARREGIQLTEELLERNSLLGSMGLTGWKLADIKAIGKPEYAVTYGLRRLAPGRSRWERGICDVLKEANVSEKLRRKACRRIIGDIGHAAEWRDYYDAARRLGEDLNDTQVLLPKDMHAMHDRVNGRLRALQEEEQRRKAEHKEAELKKRLKKLEREFTFTAWGLTLRPYRSVREVIDEGRALSICIGSYAERYAEGGTIICCLRRANEPDKPWRAVEFSRKGEVIQDRGYKNDRAAGPEGKKALDEETAELLANFWDEFRAWRAGKKKGGKAA